MEDEARPKATKPYKLTDERIDEIAGYIRAGSFRETACAAVGVDPRTLRLWLRKAEEDAAEDLETIHTRLKRELDEAEAKAEIREVARIVTAGADDWKAAAWLLERRGARRWGSKATSEAAQTTPARVVVEFAGDPRRG